MKNELLSFKVIHEGDVILKINYTKYIIKKENIKKQITKILANLIFILMEECDDE